MLSWLLENAAPLQLATSAITALVWIVYLQTFLSSYRRQQRSMILIAAGAGRGMNSHCMVTNLGFEPISILSILIEITGEEGTKRAVIPDRNELIVPDGNEDASATNLGPMPSGTMRDIGRFSTLIKRAADEDETIAAIKDVRTVSVTVVAANASSLTGAVREFVPAVAACGKATIRSISYETTQLRSRRERRALRTILQETG